MNRRRNPLATITAVQAWLAADANRLAWRRWEPADTEPPIAFGRGGRRKRQFRARGGRPRANDFPF